MEHEMPPRSGQRWFGVKLGNFGYKQSTYQPAVYYHPMKDVMIVVHVDDFLCTGKAEDLTELYMLLKQELGLKQTTLSMEDEQEATYLNRTIKVTNSGGMMTGDAKHSERLLKEWGIQGSSKEVNTPSLKELEDNICSGDELHG